MSGKPDFVRPDVALYGINQANNLYVIYVYLRKKSDDVYHIAIMHGFKSSVIKIETYRT